MSDAELTALRTTAHIAARSMNTLTERELECVLVSLIAVGTEEEGKAADARLFLLREGQKAQLVLQSVLEGAGARES